MILPNTGNRPEGQPPFTPQAFTLAVDDGEGSTFAVAFGMSLPDGSVVVAGASMLARCTDARSAARMFAADLIWTDQHGCARCSADGSSDTGDGAGQAGQPT